MIRPRLKIGGERPSRFDMGDKVYIAMAGAAARLRTLDTIADNLANAETPGFRAAQGRFEAFLASPDQSSATAPTYVAAVAAGVDSRSGAPQVTGRPLDVRVSGPGYLSVQMPDGQVGLTRDGRIEIDAEGALHIGGRPVLGHGGGGIVAPADAHVAVDEHGVVKANGIEIDRLAIHEVIGDVERAGSAVFLPARGAALLPADATLAVGEIESSNVTALESTIALVSAQRAYEHALQAIQTSRRLDERAAEVGRVRG